MRKLAQNRHLILIILILVYKISLGQSNYDLPKVIDPSPQSQAFMRYGNYPMVGYTGLTDITIPLHTIKSRKLTLPITMSFHASGRMANELNGILGMRWTLNCGAVVTRIMKGAPDEWNMLTPYSIDFYNNEVPTFDMLYLSCPDGKILHVPNINNNSNHDTEYDIFAYSLPNGKSGHFILKNQNGGKVPMLIPNDGLRIEYVKSATTNGFIDNITITDVDGTKYIFGKINESTGNAVEMIDNPDIYNGQIASGFPTAWYLTKMISSDETDQIFFSYSSLYINNISYNQTTSVYDSYRDYNASWFDDPDLDDDPYVIYLKDLIYTYHFDKDFVTDMYEARKVPNLKQIIFKGGGVSLNYTAKGADSLLSTMVFTKGDAPYKKIKFELNKHPNETDIYYLDSLLFYGQDQNQVNDKYSFSYYENVAFTKASQFMNRDWWGYACPMAGGDNLIPSQSVQIFPASGGASNPVFRDVGYTTIDRDVNEEFKKTGMLREITYPTGGQTEFIYEDNQYSWVPNYQPGQNAATVPGPGLRIKEIISKPVYGKDIHKIYKYGRNEDGMGFINELLRPGSTSYTDLTMEEGNAMHYWKYYPDASINNSFQTGYRTRVYLSDPYIRFDLGGSPVKYDVVSEYSFDENNKPQQKVQSLYSWGDNEKISNFNITDHGLTYHNIRKFANPENAWLTPVLRERRYYTNADNQYKLIKKEQYEYNSSQDDEAWDMPTYLHTNIAWLITSDIGEAVPDINYTYAKNYHNQDCSVYGYGFRKYTTGSRLLMHSTTTEYSGEDSLITNRYFTYNASNFLINTDSSVNSKAEVTISHYKYPSSFPNIAPYDQMIQKHLLSEVVESTKTTGGVEVNKMNTNYFSPFANVFVPKSVEKKNGSFAQESVATFNKYSKVGNILEQQKANDIKEVYLWGYDNRYPVARIVGSDFNTVNAHVDTSLLNTGTELQIEDQLAALRNYFRSVSFVQVSTYTYEPFIGMTSETAPNGNVTFFEYDNFGRLVNVRDKDQKSIKSIVYSYAGQPMDNAGNIIYYNVKKTVNLTRSNCAVGARGSSVTYIVPAKKYSSILSQADADNKAQGEVNTAGQAYANETGKCYFSNILESQVFTRTNCPGGGQVTYAVPAGNYMSEISQADANQKALDDISRNGQNYANAHGSCAVYLNVAQSGGFNKNDCGTGYEGSYVTYSVPANTYTSNISQADADQKAVAEIDSNGQAYANAHGTCAKVCHFTSVGSDFDIMQSSIVVNADGTTTFSITFNISTYEYYHVFEEMAKVEIAKIVGNCTTSTKEIKDSNGLLWEVSQSGGTSSLYVQIIDYIESPYDSYLPVTLTWTQ